MKEGFTFEAALDDTFQNAEFTFVFPQEYYISVGFGYTMKDAPMVVIFDDPQSDQETPTIMDLISRDHHHPRPNTENFYKLKEARNNNGTWTVTVERPLVIKRDGRDETILLDQQIGMQYAFHKAEWKKHTTSDRGIFNMTIDGVTGRVVYNKLVIYRDWFYLAHGIIMYIAWSILTFFVIATGRYMKHLYNFRMIFHILLGLLLTVSTVIIVLISLIKYPSYTDVKYNHLPIGIAVTALSVIQ